MKSMTCDEIVSIPEKTEKIEYDLPSKLFAIHCLHNDQRIFDNELMPQYTKWSQVLDVPVSTLRSWWKKREVLSKLQEERAATFSSVLAAKLEDQAIRIFSEIERRGLKKISTNALISLLKTDLTFSRIMRGKSTSNVQYTYTLYTPPRPEK